jgi:DNA polymerase
MCPQESRSRLAQLEVSMQGCTLCALRSESKIVPGLGAIKARLMLLGEAPGEQESLVGKPFVGRSGQLLQSIVRDLGLTLSDLYVLNTVKCRPPNNRTPTSEEMLVCGTTFLTHQITLVSPTVIVCVGRAATTALHLLMGKQPPTTSLRGLTFTYNGIHCLSTWHPAYILRQPNKKQELIEDIERALRYSSEETKVESLL